MEESSNREGASAESVIKYGKMSKIEMMARGYI